MTHGLPAFCVSGVAAAVIACGKMKRVQLDE